MHPPKSAADVLQNQCAALADFIRQEADAIILRWAADSCADSAGSGNVVLSRFRPEMAALLAAIAGHVHGGEIGREQSGCEAAAVNIHAERCAVSHLTSGLTEVQLVLTLQGLRNVVLQQWTENLGDCNLSVLAASLRMHQAFDNAMAAAVDHYCRIKDRCHGLFLKTLAHDLRNHLGGLELTAQIMQQNTTHAINAIHKSASTISRSVSKVMKVAGDMHDVGNVREGLGISINPVELDAAALCRTLVDEFQSRYPDQAIRCEAGGPLIGLFDASRIAQAFSNVIGYASRHTANHAPVTVKLQGTSDSIVFSVRYLSNFPVLDEVEALFSPMRRYAANVLAKKGPVSELGMPLYIAREIIIAHEGEIDATADQGWVTFAARLRRLADPLP